MTNRYLRRPADEEMIGLGRATIHKLMSEGSFPRPITLTGKAVA